MRALTLSLMLIACKGGGTNDDPGFIDADGDGLTPNAGDCDDSDASINPNSPEIWYDGIDQNCDGIDDDQDGDGFVLADDCDDEDESVHPNAPDALGDDVDTDCDGEDAGGFNLVTATGRAKTRGPVVSTVPELRTFWFHSDGTSETGTLSVVTYDNNDLEIADTESFSMNTGGAADSVDWGEPLVGLEGVFPGTHSWAAPGALTTGNGGAYWGGVSPEGGGFWARPGVIDATRVSVAQQGLDTWAMFCGPNATKMWVGDGNAFGELNGLVLHFYALGGSEACQPSGGFVYLLHNGVVTEYTLLEGGGALEATPRTFPNTYTDVLADEDVLVLVRADGLEIYEGATPIDVSLPATAMVAVDRLSATEWAIATADTAGAVTLHLGDPSGALTAVSIPGGVATDRLDVALGATGVLIGVRDGEDGWVSRTLLP